MNKADEINKWAQFAVRMEQIKKEFPEHAKEINRAVFDVGQKLDSCGDPNCTCQMNFKTFHRLAESYRSDER